MDRSGRTLRGDAEGVEGRLGRRRRGGPEEEGGDEEEPHACAATEQQIGGGLLESGVFFRPGRLRLSGNGNECRRRVCCVCTVPVGRIHEIHTYSYIAYLQIYFTLPKLMDLIAVFLAFLCEKALYIAYHYS